ncbi:alpha/beta hydrolase [Pseudanabaena sp. PCC 6802]|uniref:alpha/beta hydrolase n=1 Tax=Pseudanabaena sp. PCC 6802 TaxID=118173 RepID=UPI000346FD9D|nr:alpha/beta fold hydrolase [Pseudanabaena sp. PCC 6802]
MPINTRVRRWRKRLWWFAIGSLGLLGIGLTSIAINVYKRIPEITAPARSPGCCTVPTDRNLPHKVLRLTTQDKVQLACWYMPSRNRAAIIVLHGEGGNRLAMLPHVKMLVKAGYGVLACDRRAHGESTGDYRSWGWLEVDDVGTMLAYVRQQPDIDRDRIGILGFSMGGQVALRASAKFDDLRAIVADGASAAVSADLFPPQNPGQWPRFIADWLNDRMTDWFLAQRLQVSAPTSVVSALSQQSKHPILFISTGQTGRGRELQQVGWYYSVAIAPKQLWEIPDVGHGEGLAKHPAEYAKRVLDFFANALLKA